MAHTANAGDYGTKYTLTAEDEAIAEAGTWRKGEWFANYLTTIGNEARVAGDEMGTERTRALAHHANTIIANRRGKVYPVKR